MQLAEPADTATLPPEALDAQALMDAPDEVLAQLPDEIRYQVLDMRQQAKDQARRDEEERQRRVADLGRYVLKLYDERCSLRSQIEERWIRDIRRYNGEYEPDVKVALESRVFGSRVFVPLARRVINIVYARLIDLLFPTEERNFAVTSSAVPELVSAEGLARQLQPDQAVAMPGNQTATASAVAASIGELRAEAQAKAGAMEREVHDQLQQANFGSAARDAILDGMILGTGVVKGPMVLNRTKKVWNIVSGRGELQLIEDLSPTATQVSAWDFFPDMSARRLKDSESEIERHYLTKSQLARMAEQPGFSKEAIRNALREPAQHKRDSVRDQLRTAAGTQGVNDPRYLLLEYHGPVESELLMDMGVQLPDDPLIVYEAVLFVLENGTVIKAVIEPMDTQERPYSVWCWEKDPSSIFGFGLSYEVADMVDACNSSFRAAMDNLGLSVGPQLVVNSEIIRPHNGRWSIEPNKVWELTKKDGDVRAAFGFFQVDSRLQELLSVFDRSKALIDDIAGPVMAMQGQEAPSYLDTARGVGIAWNASNIWMRRAVRNWDDDVTTPMVGRFVDWNMQYSHKQEIKGDFLAQARGYSALLEAEGQNAKVAAFMQQAQGVPMPFKRRIAQLRLLARSLRLDDADLLPDDAEVAQMADKIDNQPPPPNPELERIKERQAELADRGQDRQFQMQMANMNAQLRMAEIASKEGLTREQAQQKYQVELMHLKAEIGDRQAQRQHDAQVLNAELTAKMATGSGI